MLFLFLLVLLQHGVSGYSISRGENAQTTSSSDLTADYCSCNLFSVYLDIVFVVDNGVGMSTKTLGDATAMIQTTLYGLPQGVAIFQSQVAVISYDSDVKIVGNFGELISNDQIFSMNIPHSNKNSTALAKAIDTASSMISSVAREFTRGVMILMTSSYFNADDLANQLLPFKSDGNLVFTLDYSQDGKDGFDSIASPGYHLIMTKDDEIFSDLFNALCDANCFCLRQNDYTLTNEKGRYVPLGGCYLSDGSGTNYKGARADCASIDAFVSTSHDANKDFFLMSNMDSSYWLGYSRNSDGVFEWADKSNSTYTNWAEGNPSSSFDCVYAKQSKGLNSPWFSADCEAATHLHACQTRPCDSTHDCRIPRLN